MVSMKDIAKRCGVSVATVSKALNGQPDIGGETRARIAAVAEEMGYMTNSAARALKTNRTYHIGVLFVDERRSGLGHEYFATMLESLSPMLIALVVILVLSASMSTLSSLVIASSSTLTIDFLKDNFIKNMSEAKQVLYIRILIVVFIAISAILALVQYTSSVNFIAQLMGISWGALAGSFLAPFMYSLYSKWVTKASCWACFIFGSGLMIANILWRSEFPQILQSPINSGSIAMLAGFIIVPVVSLFTSKPDKALVEDAFACYDKKHEVSQVTSLKD